MEVQYGSKDKPLVLLLVHLGLGKRARLRQLEFVSEMVNQHQHVVVMGDFNCQTNSPEMNTLLNNTSLCEPAEKMHTFPSWRPNRNIDHILVTRSIRTRNIQVLPFAMSDHLPIAIDITLPEHITL
jgi:endonuclease/exonuclease/phosphatase family metal-dependent hydrolase